MEKHSREKKSRLLTWIAFVIIAILATSFLVYLCVSLYLYMQTPTNVGNLLEDPENDVVLNIGTEYPGMIDVDNAALEVNGTSLKITITVKDTIPDLDDGEYAQWNVTLILENEPLKMYEICAELNSTQLSGYATEIGGSKAITCQVEYYQNSLTLSTLIDELQDANEVEWFIVTTFEKSSEEELIIVGSDIAPDEGLQTTILEK
jgi:hypothetical protein